MLKKEITNPEMMNKASIENENHFKSIFDNVPVGIFHSSPEGKLYEANKKLADILGYASPDELISTVNKTDLKECVYVNKENRLMFIEKALKDNLWHSHESKFYRKDGSIIVAELSFKALKDSDSSVKYLEGFIKDISKRKEAEKYFRKEVERESFLLELYKSAPQLTDKELYKCALDHAVSLTDSSIGFFHVISDDQKTIILKTWNGEALKTCNASLKNYYPIEQAGNWTECIKAKGPVIYNDFKNSPNRKGFPEGHISVERFMSIPVFKGDKVKFVFGVGNKVEEYDGHDVIQIQSVANELYKIIKQRHWEQALKKSETKFHELFNKAIDIITLSELGENMLPGCFIEVNETAIQKSGYTKKEFLNKTPLDLFALNSQIKVSMIATELQKKGYSTFEAVYMTKHGKQVPAEVNIHIFKLDGRDVVLSIARDITKRKKAEETVKQSELYYKTIFENTGTATFIFGEDTIISLANTECEKLSGYLKEEIVGKSWINFVTEEDKEKLMNYYYLRKVNPDSAPKNYEFKLVNKQGDIRGVYANIVSIPYTNNRLASLLDITERKKTEESLKESENRYRKLLENSFDAVVIYNENRIISANSIAMKLLGVKNPEKFFDKSIFDFIHPEYHKIAKKRVRKMLEKGEILPPVEEKFLRVNGTSVDVEILATAFIYKGEKAIQSVFRDISHRKKAENELKSSLREKEILLKEIHHRVKNNLQIISSLLDLQANYVDGKETINVLQESKNRVKSMAIIHEMLYQSKDLASIDFSSYIKNIVHDLYYSYGAKSNIKLVIDVEQVLLNIETAIPCGLIINELVSNSLKYAFPGNNAGEISVNINLHNEEFELTVSDNGIGLPENIDFKDVNTSLGLQLVNILVNQLDGSIELDKTNGTKFKIKFKELEYKKRL